VGGPAREGGLGILIAPTPSPAPPEIVDKTPANVIANSGPSVFINGRKGIEGDASGPARSQVWSGDASQQLLRMGAMSPPISGIARALRQQQDLVPWQAILKLATA
jgi:hypothetical protein